MMARPQQSVAVDGSMEVDGVKVSFRRPRAGKVAIAVGNQDRLDIGAVEVTNSVIRVAIEAYRQGPYDGDTGLADRLAGTPFESTCEPVEESESV